MPVSVPLGKVQARQRGIKLHYDFNHAGMIPEFLRITDAKQHEIRVAKRDWQKN
jgi:hypothetical protein